MIADEVLRGPEGFDEFWQGLHDQALLVDPEPNRIPRDSARPGWQHSEVRFTSVHGVNLGAELLEPVDGVDRVVVAMPGYGGVKMPFDPPFYAPRTAELTVNARGLPMLSRMDGIPDTPDEHVLHGIESREGYVVGACVQDLWAGITAARQLFPDAGRIDLRGGSFGGGLVILALPWDNRITAAAVHVPTFGDQPVRLTTPCVGSGEAVRLYAMSHPGVIDVLRFFDAATAAARITRPVIVGAARVDPMVPPAGQHAIYEALAGPRLLIETAGGHHDYPAVELCNNAFTAAARAWLEL